MQQLGPRDTQNSGAVWFISAGVVAREVADGRPVRLPIATALTQGPVGPVGLMTRADRAATPAQRRFEQAAMRTVVRLGLK